MSRARSKFSGLTWLLVFVIYLPVHMATELWLLEAGISEYLVWAVSPCIGAVVAVGGAMAARSLARRIRTS